MEAALAHGAATGADAASIAEAGCAIWRRISAVLSPVIGQMGVVALYRRSLHLTRATYPWLPAAGDDAGEHGDFAALRDALAAQPGPSAAAANIAVLATFYDILSGLVGAALTERLLGSVLDTPSTEHAAQDSPP